MKQIRVAIPKAVSKVRIDRTLEMLEKHTSNPQFADGHISFSIESDKSDDFIAQTGMLIGLTLMKQF